MTIPTDRVDPELLERPSQWDTALVRRFMAFFGFTVLPPAFLAILAGMVAVYLALAEVGNAWFYRPELGCNRSPSSAPGGYTASSAAPPLEPPQPARSAPISHLMRCALAVSGHARGPGQQSTALEVWTTGPWALRRPRHRVLVSGGGPSLERTTSR